MQPSQLSLLMLSQPLSLLFSLPLAPVLSQPWAMLLSLLLSLLLSQPLALLLSLRCLHLSLCS